MSVFVIKIIYFNLYIITTSHNRFNLLLSFTLPLIIEGLKTLQTFFENQFNENTSQYLNKKII